MPKMRKVGGAWRSVAARYRKIGGQWRRVKESYRKVAGIWVKTFESTYLETYVINPDPANSNAGVYYDAAVGAYRAYIYGRPNGSSVVEVGIRIGNIPRNSEIRLELATYDGITNTVNVVLDSNGSSLGWIPVTKDATYFVKQNVNAPFTLKIVFNADNTNVTNANFVLSDVKINNVSIPLP